MVTVSGQTAEFSFFRPRARGVRVVGDFNGWTGTPMTRTPHGYWTARVRLPIGDFKFRYDADGEWFADYAAFGLEYGQFGLDSIVHVAPDDDRGLTNPLTQAS